VRVEFLGTGGAVTTPRPFCDCRVCVEAREKGVPYSRSGPSVFVHGPDVLVDTPEEIKAQLNRSTITEISACFYSHWHPDHVMGRRVWEMNLDFRAWPRRSNPTDVYLPEQVGKDFREMLGSWEHFEFLEKLGTARIVEMQDGARAEIQDTRITPFRVAHDYVYAFLFEGENERLLVAPDELKGWTPPEFLHGLDLAVLPMGLAEFDPFTGERRIPKEHPILRLEATFDDTMEIVAKLGAKRTILTHVEEIDGLTHDDLQALGERLRGEGKNVEFAYDTLIVDV